MKRLAGRLGIAGLVAGLAGCATTVNVGGGDAFVAKESSEMATGFLNQAHERNGKSWRYVTYVPHDYTPDEAWPLIVFLHGAGERGDDGLAQTEVGIGRAIRFNPERFPAIVIFPQCPKERFWDSIIDDIEQAMARAREEYHIDETRIYLTGLSMGGYGTWIWGALKTDTFAALMPICGGGSLLEVKAMADKPLDYDFRELPDRVEKLADIPIWAFHGADDATVPPMRSRQMVKLVKKAGGNVQYTEFPKTAHNSWDDAYAHAKAIRWLFKQRRNVAK